MLSQPEAPNYCDYGGRQQSSVRGFFAASAGKTQADRGVQEDRWRTKGTRLSVNSRIPTCQRLYENSADRDVWNGETARQTSEATRASYFCYSRILDCLLWNLPRANDSVRASPCR
jgi:hypothetical protein